MPADSILDLALRLNTAYHLAKEAGHSEVDAWRNVALVVQRDAERAAGFGCRSGNLPAPNLTTAKEAAALCAEAERTIKEARDASR